MDVARACGDGSGRDQPNLGDAPRAGEVGSKPRHAVGKALFGTNCDLDEWPILHVPGDEVPPFPRRQELLAEGDLWPPHLLLSFGVQRIERPTQWRLSARRQPSAGAAWLAEPRFPTRVYRYGSTALPFFVLQRTCRLAIAEFPSPRSPLWPPRQFSSTRLPPPRSVRRPGSLASAKQRPSCFVLDWIREPHSELRSNSRARPRETDSCCLLDHFEEATCPYALSDSCRQRPYLPHSC